MLFNQINLKFQYKVQMLKSFILFFIIQLTIVFGYFNFHNPLIEKNEAILQSIWNYLPIFFKSMTKLSKIISKLDMANI